MEPTATAAYETKPMKHDDPKQQSCFTVTVLTVTRMQGSSHTGRTGGSARFISIVGLGKKEEAVAEADWGKSAFQVNRLHEQYNCAWSNF